MLSANRMSLVRANYNKSNSIVHKNEYLVLNVQSNRGLMLSKLSAAHIICDRYAILYMLSFRGVAQLSVWSNIRS